MTTLIQSAPTPASAASAVDAPRFRSLTSAQSLTWRRAGEMETAARSGSDLPKRLASATAAFEMFDLSVRFAEPNSSRRQEALKRRAAMSSLVLTILGELGTDTLGA